MPSRGVLLLLLALVVLPPFVAQATGSVVGSYTMFNRIERYHLELAALTPHGERRLTVRSLASHLSPEARRILLPADGHAVGADQVDSTVAGLTDIAELVCAAHDDARRARVRLLRDPFDPARRVAHEASADCRAMP